MNLKDFVRISADTADFTSRELIAGAAKQLLAAAAAYTASGAAVANGLLPFGLSFLAGSPPTYVPAAAIGAFLGYFIPAVGNGGFRYTAALFALLALRLLLSGVKRISGRPGFSAVGGLSVSLFTSVVSFGGITADIPNTVLEALLCGAGAFFVARGFKILTRPACGLSNEELSELLVFISIVLLGFSGIELNGISLGRILSVLLILSAAKYGGALSGAVSGIAVAFGQSLSGASGMLGISLAFAGLAVGIFSPRGKYVQSAILLTAVFIGISSDGSTLIISRTVVEAALGAALFLTLPRGAGIYLGRIFSASPRPTVSRGFKKTVTMRLEMASAALKDVSQTVEKVSAELAKINAPDFGDVLTAVEHDACGGCKLRIHCWEAKREDTVNAVLEMTRAVKRGETSPENAAPEEFRGRCFKPSRVGNAAYRRYSDYASRIAAENRIDEVRSVVSDQFNGISSMLAELSADLKKDERFDTAAARKASAALNNIDLRVSDACCKIDAYGRMTAEFKVKRLGGAVINKFTVMKLVSVACERDFDPPEINEAEGESFITLSEDAALRVDFGAEQLCAAESGMCGDAYKRFFDGKGHFIMVLSDGMGTGGRAAVDGAMASGLMSRLIRAGFGYDCSLKILNSSMLFKSTDESLATVDIASIDLFNGKLELYKAGAAPTVLRRSGRTGKAESTSLPAGILREIGFDTASVKCKAGDIVLLLSDGATASGTDWIRDELEAWTDGTAQQLAEKICESASRRQTDTRGDDITVLAAIISKAAS